MHFPGISNYLNKYSYDYANQVNLWTELNNANSPLPDGLEIKCIMDTWTRQKGFPILNVNRNRTEVNYKKSFCTLRVS